MCNAANGPSEVLNLRYKKIVDSECKHIAFIGHYPIYEESELYDGGYASVTKVIVEGPNAICKKLISDNTNADMNVGENASIKIQNAQAVYLITAIDRSFHITGMDKNNTPNDIMRVFQDMDQYSLLDTLYSITEQVSVKYTTNNCFNYEMALAPSAKEHSEELNRVSFELYVAGQPMKHKTILPLQKLQI